MLPEDVELSHNISGNIQAFFSSSGYDKVAAIVDENTRSLCLPLIEDALPPSLLIEIRSGEEYKTLETCQTIWEALTNYKCDRKSLVVNLGGGVIGDMGGFCAATYKRGIDFINIPTTLLAQVDASVGGKLGIDFMGYKNHIGVFVKPKKVFVDTVFLDTLPREELRSGFAEVIKHCLIADAGFWETISAEDIKEQPWPEIVAHSIEVKNRIVKDDPFEKGLRKILNYGHTIGHAIESHFLKKKDNRLLHGEAIAIGMICEAYLSELKCNFPMCASKKIESYLLQTFGRISLTSGDINRIVHLCQQDKKNEKGIINFSLLEDIGKPVFNIGVEQEDIRKVIQRYALIK
jgi:3-dehydroquinate synthase